MSSRTRKKPKAEEDEGGEELLSVPEEICFEVLLRVPAKSTYVCKCVCKSWFQIITNPSFVKMHLNIATQRNNCNLMFESYDIDNSREEQWIMKSISCDSLSSVHAIESEAVEMVGCPFSCSYWTSRFLGSCNGLVCLCSSGSTDESTDEIFVYIYNPATKEYKKIPKSQQYKEITKSGYDYWDDYDVNMINAFGYDCKADDYKLINVVQYGGSTDQLLDVYALGSKSWESRRQTVAYEFLKEGQTGILVHGAFHWFAKTREKNPHKLIISMNMITEKFDEVHLSKELMEKRHLGMTIGVLEGCLCLVVTAPKVRFGVWMMQDYGVQESWTQVYTIGRGRISRIPHTLRLVHSFQNGQILLM